MAMTGTSDLWDAVYKLKRRVAALEKELAAADVGAKSGTVSLTGGPRSHPPDLGPPSFDLIVKRAQHFVRNQHARGAFDEPGLRDITVRNLVVMILQDAKSHEKEHI
jgi:hypothetical protein